MQTEIKYEYSPELVKRVSRRFLLKTMIWQYVLALALGLYALFTFLIGIESWFQGVPITLLVIYIFHWLGYERNAAAVAQNLASRSVIVRLDDEAISFQTIDQETITKWSRFKQVMKLQEAWLFFT